MNQDYFTDANYCGEKEDDTSLSPSGRYRLTVKYYGTKPGCWNYSRGIIHRISDNQQICDLKRNYGSFTHSFVTKNEQEWLISGRDYQNQTLVNLETGKEYQPPETEDIKKGVAFCWVSSFLSPDGNILVVEGCHWACPYEFRFFDFTDPSLGWPELKFDPEDILVEADKKRPVFNADGTITCYQTRSLYLPLQKFEYDIDLDECQISDDDYEKESNWEQVDCVRRIFQKKENHLVQVNEWLSEEEQERRRLNEIARKKFEDWMKSFKAEDPLYLKYKELLVANPKLSTDYESYGITYPNWSPDFKEKETRWCRRLLYAKGKGWTVDLDWAVKTGPIKLTIFKDGNTSSTKFYPHSVEGMITAFEETLQMLKENESNK